MAQEKLVKVKMVVAMASPENNRNVGDEPSVPEDEAKRLIEAGFAKAVGGRKNSTTAADTAKTEER